MNKNKNKNIPSNIESNTDVNISTSNETHQMYNDLLNKHLKIEEIPNILLNNKYKKIVDNFNAQQRYSFIDETVVHVLLNENDKNNEDHIKCCNLYLSKTEVTFTFIKNLFNNNMYIPVFDYIMEFYNDIFEFTENWNGITLLILNDNIDVLYNLAFEDKPVIETTINDTFNKNDTIIDDLIKYRHTKTCIANNSDISTLHIIDFICTELKNAGFVLDKDIVVDYINSNNKLNSLIKQPEKKSKKF